MRRFCRPSGSSAARKISNFSWRTAKSFRARSAMPYLGSIRRRRRMRSSLPEGAISIWIERRKKDLQFQLANGQIVSRSVGYAVLRVDKAETVDEVVFAERGDLQLLGARALEGLNLHVDSRRKRLVAAGPIVSAAAEIGRAHV